MIIVNHFYSNLLSIFIDTSDCNPVKTAAQIHDLWLGCVGEYRLKSTFYF